ncbi:hypothetical protein HMSSN036_46600 [Paenibacillus macerans]|nr:hypothetical protein HMSSN036_46600 [Paenibacillus macerans]
MGQPARRDLQRSAAARFAAGGHSVPAGTLCCAAKPDDGCIRLTVAALEDARLREGLARIAAALAGLRRVPGADAPPAPTAYRLGSGKAIAWLPAAAGSHWAACPSVIVRSHKAASRCRSRASLRSGPRRATSLAQSRRPAYSAPSLRSKAAAARRHVSTTWAYCRSPSVPAGVRQ